MGAFIYDAARPTSIDIAFDDQMPQATINDLLAKIKAAAEAPLPCRISEDGERWFGPFFVYRCDLSRPAHGDSLHIHLEVVAAHSQDENPMLDLVIPPREAGII